MKKKISRKRTKRTRPTKQKARTTRHKRLTRQKAQHSKKRTNMKRSKRSYKKYNRERIIQEGGMKKLFGCSYCGAKSRRTSPESMTEEQQQAQLQRILDNLHAEKQGRTTFAGSVLEAQARAQEAQARAQEAHAQAEAERQAAQQAEAERLATQRAEERAMSSVTAMVQASAAYQRRLVHQKIVIAVGRMPEYSWLRNNEESKEELVGILQLLIENDIMILIENDIMTESIDFRTGDDLKNKIKKLSRDKLTEIFSEMTTLGYMNDYTPMTSLQNAGITFNRGELDKMDSRKERYEEARELIRKRYHRFEI
tara:strand:- start:256 stop:1188 length:933 start_codon:yes stop_codon:yes gene_type:complete